MQGNSRGKTVGSDIVADLCQQLLHGRAFLYILNRIDHKDKQLAACRNLSAFAFELPSQLPFTDRFGTEMIDAIFAVKVSAFV